MVSDRRGLEKWWDLADRVLPDEVRRQRLGDTQVARRAIELSLKCLGVGTAQHVAGHFTHGYPGLATVLAAFEKSGLVERVDVVHDGSPLRGTWFVHRDDVPLLERIERGEWRARTTLLSPFDNLLHDRKRLLTMFDLDYRMEIYVPVAKRKYGYYTMPLLDGDRFIGRVDPAFDRGRSALVVNSIVPEPDVRPDRSTAVPVATAVRDLASWLGASTIDVAPSVAAPWRRLG